MIYKKQVARWQLVLQIVTRWTLDVLLSSSTSTPRKNKKKVPPSVQLLLEEVWAIEANMAAPPIMVRG